MKLIRSDIRFLIITILLLILVCLKGNSQGTDLKPLKQSGFYIGINVSSSQTNILNSFDDASLVDVKPAAKNTLFGSIELGYQFSRFFSFSTGIGFSSYATTLSLTNYSNKYDTTDSEGDNYKRMVSGNDISETQKIACLSVPLLLNLNVPFTNNVGLYLQTGLNLSLPLNNKYTSTGNFSYTGYYSIYDVTLENIQYEKLLNNQITNETGKLEISSFSSELITSAGFYFTLKNKIQVSLGAFYNKMLSDISGYSNSGSFRLSSRPDQMKSLMEASSGVTTQSIGLRISIRYYFR